MGSFTKRLTRRAQVDLTSYFLTDEVLGPFSKVAKCDRSFALRQLTTDEADGTDAQFRRAACRIGGKQTSARETHLWWWRIGPRGRAAVRLCFFSIHAPDKTCT